MAIRPISWRVLAIILDDQEGGTCGSIDLPVPAGGDDDRLAAIGGAGAVACDPRATGPPSELAWPDSGATVTPALGLAAAASALATSRPNLLYVTAGVVGGRAALEGAAAAVSAGVSTRLPPPLAQLPAPAVHALAALVRAAPAAIAAVYLDAAAPPEAAGLLRGSGAGAVVYWPAPGGGSGSGGGGGMDGGGGGAHLSAPVVLASPPPSAPAASLMGHAFFAALAAPGATVPEAFAVGLCALQAHGAAGAPPPRRAAVVEGEGAPPPTHSPDPDLPRPRLGLPLLDCAHPPALPSLDSVPLPADLAAGGGGAVAASAVGGGRAESPGDRGWGDTRLYAPPGETVLTLAGRPRPSPRRLAYLCEGLRALLAMQARAVVITSAVRADPPAVAGPPLPPGAVASAACGLATPAGPGGSALVAGPAAVLTSPARLEAAVRAGTLAAALTSQVHPPGPWAGEGPAPPAAGGPGVPGALSALAAARPASAPFPACALTLSSPLWGIITLAAIAGRVEGAAAAAPGPAAPPPPGAGPAGRLLAALGIAGVGSAPVASFDAATALRFAAASAEPPLLPVVVPAGGGGPAAAAAPLLTTAILARRDPRVSSAGADRPGSGGAAAAAGPPLPPASRPPSAKRPRTPPPPPDPARPPLAACPRGTLAADLARFVDPAASPAAGRPWPDALLHGRPIDGVSLYRAVAAAGGSAALRAAKAGPAAWTNAVLPALLPNAPAAGPLGGRAPSALGEDLARLYMDTLAAYEAAYPGDMAAAVKEEGGGGEGKRVRV